MTQSESEGLASVSMASEVLKSFPSRDFLETEMFHWGNLVPAVFKRISLAGLALDSATSSGLGRAPALQCTPSRHHLELQDRRDYTPADRAARTCWLGCPGLPVLSGGLRRKTQLSPVPCTWPLPPRDPTF
ncbi:hypothetical protein TNCV_4528561 [Trichonephila clavipes]|nr:hypothetical protein TNCV_4528561 [Trichonephila clavipes]